MFTIDLLIKQVPIPLSVEKKEEADAQALYNKVLEAIKSPETQIIELTCDKQTEKKIAVISDQLAGVVISQKDGGTTGGKVPGFFAAINEK
jgi:hypothetical protein